MKTQSTIDNPRHVRTINYQKNSCWCSTPSSFRRNLYFEYGRRLYRSSLSGKLSYAMRKNRNLSNRPIIAVTNLVTFIKEHPQPNSNSEIVTGVTCSRRGMMRGYLSKVVISQEIRQQQLDDDFLRAET